jgi:hypothetical protein
MVRRGKSLKIGTDSGLKMVGATAIGIYDGNIEFGLGSFVRKNLMCRLNLNDHNNLIDGIDPKGALSSLGQNYPNPFSGTTEIAYELADGTDVSVEIMDMTGRMVVNRTEGFKPAGKHSLTLGSAGLEAGVYYYTLKAGQFRETKQMVVF